MELALTFGAIGDFLSIALLIKDIISALDESRGSAKAYRGLIDEITQLHQALEQVEHIYHGPDIPSGLSDLVSIAQTTVSHVRETLRAFHSRVCKKYGDSLAEGGSGNIFKDAARKIQFKLEEKDVVNFRTELASHRMSLELFLQITTVRLEKENHKAVMAGLSATAERTTAVVHRYGHSIESRLGFLGRRILSKLDFLARLGIDMTKSASQILSMMFAVSGDLSIIRSVVLRLDRGVNNGEHFVLEDATGRSFPIHLKTITSWEAFNFILEDRFKGKKGERRTRRKLYSLHESASHLEIDRSAHFESAFSPYQKVDMSLICKAPVALTTDDGDTGLSSCPWCKTVSPGKLGDRVQCSTCRRDFLRVVIEVEDSEDPLTPPSSAPVPQRIADVQFGKPSLGTLGKRAREDDGDDDEACNECHRPKRPKAARVDDRKRKRSGETDSDSESDEENLAGLAHVTLQTKRMRLSEPEKRPFHAAQVDSFDILARKVLGDNPVPFTALSIDSKNGETRSRFARDASKARATEVLPSDESDEQEEIRPPDEALEEDEHFTMKELLSPSPTPSPRGSEFAAVQRPSFYHRSPTSSSPLKYMFEGEYGTTRPTRPARKPHFRSPLPRYTSDGQYATANVSRSHYDSRSLDTTLGGDSDDETIEIAGVTYTVLKKRAYESKPLPEMDRWAQIKKNAAERAAQRQDRHREDKKPAEVDGDTSGEETIEARVDRIKARVAELTGNATAAGQEGTRQYQKGTAGLQTSQGTGAGTTAESLSSSMPTPANASSSTESTTKDTERTGQKRPVEQQGRIATEVDAKRHGIPPGYSLKNWDPEEEPIMLLGSVFDANSLGKWIYDWSVYHHGPATPVSDMAGDLWLLLIKLAGKIRRAESITPKIRLKDNRELVEDFIEAGDRLTDKLRKLLKACEAPMLRSKRKTGEVSGKGAGVEFIETLFGKDRELEKTERFMASARLWNLRFDTHCEEILREPAM